jgi:hypothetical protein
MSGTNATFTLKEGKRLDEKALEAALKENKITFESVERRDTPKAAAAYVAQVEGLT